VRSSRPARAGLAGSIAALLLAGAAGAAEAPAPLAGRNLILITLDTTRADYFSTYGGPAGLTPHLDALGAEGVVFENAYSQTNVTNPSHAAIFTGAYAIDLEILNNSTSFAGGGSGADTLAAAFQRAGYRTGAFPSTPHVSSRRLDLPGFDHEASISQDAVAATTVARSLAWIRSDDPRPFFAWIHFFDPHLPYQAPPGYPEQFYNSDPTRGKRPLLRTSAAFREAPRIARHEFRDVRDPYYPIAMYKAEIRYLDDEIGRLLEQLREAKLDATTGIVVIADHGESLGEHGIYYDHAGLFEATLHIPFLARLPGFPSGVRVAARVGQIDLAPTLERLYGVSLRPGLPRHGLDLSAAMRGLPAAEAGLGEERASVHEDAHNRVVMARRGPWKLIVSVSDPWFSRDRVSLFNLDDDPRETRNVADEHPEIVEALTPLVARWVAAGSWRKVDPDVDAREIERLRALGYVEEDAPDPQRGGATTAPR